VSSGGVASATTISSGGSEYVLSGGTDIAAVISAAGTQYVESGGTAISGIVDAGGVAYVAAGATASGRNIGVGGSEYIYSGGTVASAVIASGGTAVVYGGGILTGSIVENGALIFNGSDTFSGTLSGSGAVVVSSGNLVLSGGDAFAGTLAISNGAMLELSSASTAGGGAIAFAGVSATLRIDGPAMPTNVISVALGNSIDPAGISYVSGATAQLTSGSDLQVVDSGHTYNLQLNPSQNLSGWSFSLSTDGGSGTIIAAQQTIVVSSGQTVSNASVPIDGFEEVYGTAASTTVTSGGEQDVFSGGIASAPVINSGGIQKVYSGGTATRAFLD
jgi:autotransporter passenger strand-loop-strand repeat protein